MRAFKLAALAVLALSTTACVETVDQGYGYSNGYYAPDYSSGGSYAQSAAYAVVTTHHQLAAAATQAHQWAAADPLMARLQAAIDGRPAAPQVVDVQATELPRSRPDTGDTSGITNITNIADVADATGAGRTTQPGQAPTPAA